jgi:PHD/YefM family antitoxin component YafN of YafNO toxin-antitoxin module
MKTVAAQDLQRDFHRVLDNVGQEPIAIEQDGNQVAVVLSMTAFRRLEALEDEWWGRRAREAEEEGSIGQAESEALLQRLLNASH